MLRMLVIALAVVMFAGAPDIASAQQTRPTLGNATGTPARTPPSTGEAGSWKCDRMLVCAQVQSCKEGKLYPTMCGPRNCDLPIGTC